MKNEEFLLSILADAGAAQNIKEQQGQQEEIEQQQGQEVLLTKRTQYATHKTAALELKKQQQKQKTYTLRDGSTYTGELKDGKPHGQGTQTNPDGLKYVGEYRDGFMHGQGTLTLADGTSYTGGYKDGEPHGQGTLTRTDGVTYTGEWKDGKQHGQGTKTNPDGATLTGEFRDGSIHGQGTLTHADGATHTGEFKDGKLPVQTTWVHPNGYTYTGNWKDVGPHGQGTMAFPDGTTYTGGYKDGKRHGQGTETNNPDRGRATYTGVWKDGKKPSHWPETNPDGAILTGESQDGVLQDVDDGQTADTSTVITEVAPKGKHAPVAAEPTEVVTVTLSKNHKTFKTESGDYRLERYKDSKIKAFKDDQVCSNTKNVLRAINKEYKLGFTSGDFKKMHTRKLGKEIIEKMKMVHEKDKK